MVPRLPILTATLSLLSGASAARSCASPTFNWRVLDLVYQGAAPAKNSSGLATALASIQPGPRGSIFECVGQWPESWGGWYNGGSSIVWSDCIWTGSGPTNDTTVSFALDWKKPTIYLTHSYGCLDQKGSDGLATGSLALDMNCTATDAGKHCTVANAPSRPNLSPLNITTSQAPARLNDSATCSDNSKMYQSWQLVKWSRQYDVAAGSWSAGVTTLPAVDSGPTFTIKSMANKDIFECKPSGKEHEIFSGSCKSTAGDAGTTAKFDFDPKLSMLTVTQQWSCNGSTFDAVGVGYVQATCDLKHNTYDCWLDPVWIGTKPV